MSSTSSNKSNSKSSSNKSGIDVLLSQRGKSIKPGEEIRFTLVKGKSGSMCADPVQSKAPPETFPLMAKFPESVVKPDFSSHQWSKARLYQQDAPKVKVSVCMNIYVCDYDSVKSLHQTSLLLF
jgi:hypothetical protein